MTLLSKSDKAMSHKYRLALNKLFQNNTIVFNNNRSCDEIFKT